MIVKDFTKLFLYFGVNPPLANYFSSLLLLVVIILIGFLLKIILKSYFVWILKRIVLQTTNKWDDLLIKNKLPEKFSYLVPAIAVYFLTSQIFGEQDEKLQNIIHLVCSIYIIVGFVFIVNSIINTIDQVYENYEVSSHAPIKSFLQMIKILLFILSAIIIISLLINKSPWMLIKAMGALTAVAMLVFKDPLLGLVASIQLTTQKMLQKGDWIEMPQYRANGYVIDISLTTVKVQNFDKTIANIPAYSLVSDSFKNWRGMEIAGGRRIMRSLYLDINTFKFLKENDIENLMRIELLKGYLRNKCDELKRLNNNKDIDNWDINSSRLTNIGAFRYYIQEYLKNHINIHNNMSFIVRQLEPSDKGLPLQIYVFCNNTNWQYYEAIQSEIFDHLLTVIPEFGLSVFQSPSGKDFNRLING